MLKIKLMNDNLIGILFFAILFTALYFYTSNKFDEKKFRLKYETAETIGVINDISIRGRNTTCQLEFNILDRRYNTSGGTPIKNFQQLNDAFVILYEINNPENNIILYQKPIITDSLFNLKGTLSYFKMEKNRVCIELEYYYNNDKINRLQFFSIDKAVILEKFYKEKREVVIGVVPQNVRRGYLNFEESLK